MMYFAFLMTFLTGFFVGGTTLFALAYRFERKQRMTEEAASNFDEDVKETLSVVAN